jgi:glycosyltransferase involved in cell wall biosynthesis
VPKVSVNICCYNSEKYIKETIQSVLDQTFNDFEVIIIDDGSRDKSAEIIKSFSDQRLKYYYQNNQGLSSSRNRAIELSGGEYIALLDHDDLWNPNKLEKQIALFEKNPELALVFSNCYIISADGTISGTYFDINSPARGKVFDQLILRDFIPCLSAVIRKAVLIKTGLFRLDFKMAEEYDLFLRISKIAPIDYVDEPLASYRWHENNLSCNNPHRINRECVKIMDDWLKRIKENRSERKLYKIILKNKLRLTFNIFKEIIKVFLRG